MELWLVRHGLTALNVEGRFNGWREDSLLAEQADRLRSTRLELRRFDAIYCSALTRCIETARCLGIGSFRSEPRIAERKLGVFEGLTAVECRERFADDFAQFIVFDAEYRIPGGESRAENLERVMSWLREVGALRSVLAITHGGTIDFLYRLATGHPLHGGTEIFSGSSASVSEFEVDLPQVRLLGFDRPL
jgi:broad specificity phosphatase PhoE